MNKKGKYGPKIFLLLRNFMNTQVSLKIEARNNYLNSNLALE